MLICIYYTFIIIIIIIIGGAVLSPKLYITVKRLLKKIGWKYPTKQIINNSVPKGIKDKVYSSVVSPDNKCCLVMAHVWPKHVAVTSNVHS
jgi:hypothetical protein